ncbi:MAG: copper resistance protein CopC [Thermoleophilia bacterium]
MKRTIVLVALAAAVLAFPASSLAHTDVRSTSPADGAVRKKAPARVSITFTGQILSGSIVVRKAGKVVSTGSNGIDPRNVARLTVKLKSGLGNGRYVVSWTAKAPDGHRQKGTFDFRVKST